MTVRHYPSRYYGDDPPAPVAGFAARELARLAAENDALRLRVSGLEGELARVKGRLARVLRAPEIDSRLRPDGQFANRGRVWSSRRTGGKR